MADGVLVFGKPLVGFIAVMTEPTTSYVGMFEPHVVTLAIANCGMCGVIDTILDFLSFTFTKVPEQSKPKGSPHICFFGA